MRKRGETNQTCMRSLKDSFAEKQRPIQGHLEAMNIWRPSMFGVQQNIARWGVFSEVQASILRIIQEYWISNFLTSCRNRRITGDVALGDTWWIT